MKTFIVAGLMAAAAAAYAGPEIRMTSELEDLIALYRRGDYRAAFKGFGVQARKGEALAQAMLGKMYADGQGTARDDALAVEWLTRAAARGDDLAQNRLGDMYTDGRGVAQDLAKAAGFYREAARQHNAAACYRLAQAYEEGSGVPLDQEMALTYYRQAAELGHAGAKSRLEDRRLGDF